MTDVKVLFTGDTSSLSKAAKDAVDKLKTVDKAASTAQKSTAGLSTAAQGLQKGLSSATGGTRQAQIALTNFNRVVQDAPFGFIAIQNNIDPLIDSFVNLRRETGSSRKALGALVGAFSGPAGILTAVSIASTAFLAFGDKIADAFNKGKKAAEDAKKAFSSVLDDTISFEGLQGERIEFRSIESVQRAIKAVSEQISTTEKDIARFEKQRVAAGFAAGTQALNGGGSGQAEAERLQQSIINSEARLDKLRQTLVSFETAAVKFRASEDLKGILSGLGDSDLTIQDNPFAPLSNSISAFNQEADKLRSLSIPDLSNLFSEDPTSDLDRIILKMGNVRRAVEEGILTSAEGTRREFALLQQQLLLLSESGLTGFDQLVGRLSELRTELGSTTETSEDVGVAFEIFSSTAQEALEAIIFKTNSLGDALRSVGRRLLSTFLTAGVNVGIGAITGNPLSFGNALAGAVGIPVGASSAAPTADLSKATLSSSQLNSFGGAKVQVEATATRISGGDLLLTIQEAQNTRGTGGINIS